MRKLLLLLAIIFGTAAARAEEPLPPSSKEIRQLLQQGLFEEEANRDLTKAAAAYSALVEKYDQQRAWAATALFRLAEVRAKQGDKAAAVELHQRLLAEFPNQEPLAGLSRERLATLGGTAPAAVAQPQDVTEEEARELARIREMAKNSPDLINAVDPQTRTTTPLAAAAKAGQVQVAEFLLKNGAEVNGAGKSFPPLVLAAEEGHKRWWSCCSPAKQKSISRSRTPEIRRCCEPLALDAGRSCGCSWSGARM
jgi:tetratricopeptide (TPR) repeat protein